MSEVHVFAVCDPLCPRRLENPCLRNPETRLTLS